jgi:hypothetical protein
MSDIDIRELNTEFVFRQRPEAIPGDLRPIWRIGLVLLMLYMASRGGKSSFGKLHVLNWALRSQEGRKVLLDILERRLSPGTVIVRIEPSLNRAVDLAHGECLVKRNKVGIELTSQGQAEAKRILEQKDIYLQEKEFLNAAGKRVTEKLVKELFCGQD